MFSCCCCDTGDDFTAAALITEWTVVSGTWSTATTPGKLVCSALGVLRWNSGPDATEIRTASIQIDSFSTPCTIRLIMAYDGPDDYVAAQFSYAGGVGVRCELAIVVRAGGVDTIEIGPKFGASSLALEATYRPAVGGTPATITALAEGNHWWHRDATGATGAVVGLAVTEGTAVFDDWIYPACDNLTPPECGVPMSTCTVPNFIEPSGSWTERDTVGDCVVCFLPHNRGLRNIVMLGSVSWTSASDTCRFVIDFEDEDNYTYGEVEILNPFTFGTVTLRIGQRDGGSDNVLVEDSMDQDWLGYQVVLCCQGDEVTLKIRESAVAFAELLAVTTTVTWLSDYGRYWGVQLNASLFPSGIAPLFGNNQTFCRGTCDPASPYDTCATFAGEELKCVECDEDSPDDP